MSLMCQRPRLKNCLQKEYLSGKIYIPVFSSLLFQHFLFHIILLSFSKMIKAVSKKRGAHDFCTPRLAQISWNSGLSTSEKKARSHQLPADQRPDGPIDCHIRKLPEKISHFFAALFCRKPNYGCQPADE
ncbi:MAG: hypothetical protein WC643_00085 [Parcubacteria group bacterium]